MLSHTEKALSFFAAIGALTIIPIIYQLSRFLFPYFRPNSLSKYNKTAGSWALVTGASDGIGLALAHELCSKGFNIILHGRSPTKLLSAKSQLSTAFPSTQLRTFIADASAPTKTTASLIKNLLRTIEADKLHLTVLINNVGGTANLRKDFTSFADHTSTEIDDLISINMLFATHLTHALLPLLTQHSPSLILNTGSQSHIGMPYMTVYSATKAYLSAWSNALSMEMQAEKTGVEVLTVLSGNTQSGQDKREAGVWRPSSGRFARAALGKVGVGRGVVVGYWGHAVQGAVLGWLPEGLLRWTLIAGLGGMKGKDLDET